MSRARPRRRLFWARQRSTAEGINLTDTNRATSHNLLSNYQEAASGDVEGVTVTRIRGRIYWVPPATTVQEYSSLGIGVETANLTDINGLTPAAQLAHAQDPYRDWMYYHRHWTASSSVDTGAFSELEGWPNHIELDLKSQRRFDELSESLFLGLWLDDTVGDGNEMKVFYDLSVLLKRP